jgi:predicted transcriptional regulator
MAMLRSALKRVNDDRPQQRFTILPNELIYDASIDWRAKSLAVYLWSLKDDSDVSTHALAKTLRMGQPKVRQAIADLIAAGWLQRRENRGGPDGKVYQYVYLIDPVGRISGPITGSTPDPVTGSTANPLTNNVTTHGVFARDDGSPTVKQDPWGRTGALFLDRSG